LSWNLHGTIAQDGDLAELVGLRHRQFIITLKAGANFQTHRGVIQHDDMIGRPWGSQIFSHLGSPFFLMQPSLGDLLREIRRTTQILYPKEIGYILINMGIGPGLQVVEAGTGSGALTTALAFMVGREGHVTSYEVRPEFQKLARSNLELVGLADRVTFKLGDIAAGFEETGVDAVFLDVANSYDYIAQARQALKPGGFFGSILPTTNQVVLLLNALRQQKFAFLDVCEILLRYYKSEPDRFRPVDRMVAHTGYLVFGRPVLVSEDERGAELLAETLSDEPEA
jgi:tRNA (adenine57-N1/adenine58-N1)-methyltransferase